MFLSCYKKYLVYLMLTVVALAGAAWGIQADVYYKTVTTFDMPGFLGRLVKMATPDELVTETYISGNRLMTKNDQSAEIIDLDAETFTSIDYRNKTYSTITFDELRALWEQQMEQMKAEQEKAEAEQASADQTSTDEEEVDVNVAFDVRIDRPGDHATINGHQAERFIVTVLADIEAQAEQEATEAGEEGQVETVRSQLVLVTESWRANLEGFDAAQAFYQQLGAEMGEAFLGEGDRDRLMEVITAMMQDDPRLQESLERAADELAEMEGTNAGVRTITHIVLVPEGKEYNADLVVAKNAEAATEEQPKEKKKGRFGRFAKKLAEQAAGVGTEEEEAPKDTEQRTILTITNNLNDYSTGAIDPSTFAIPSGFKEKPYMPE